MICVTDLAGLCQLSNMQEISEQLPWFFAHVIFTASAYIFSFQSKRFVAILNSLTEIVHKNIKEEAFCRIIHDQSKKIVLIITILWVTVCICINIYTLPLLRHMLKGDEVSEKFLPLKSWYPYDTSKYPYFHISGIIEIFRIIALGHVIAGGESFFMILTFQVANQLFILSDKIIDIFERVKKTKQITQDDISKECCEKCLECNKTSGKEINRELKDYIAQHISLTK